MRNSKTYIILCDRYDGVVAHYKGKSSMTIHTRGQEHLRQLKSKKFYFPLWSHCQEHHGASLDMVGVQIKCFYGMLVNRKSTCRQPAVAEAKFSTGIGLRA